MEFEPRAEFKTVSTAALKVDVVVQEDAARSCLLWWKFLFILIDLR